MKKKERKDKKTEIDISHNEGESKKSLNGVRNLKLTKS